MRRPIPLIAAAATIALILAFLSDDLVQGAPVRLPPTGAAMDYQLGGAYRLPTGVRIVVRDWHDAKPATRKRSYSICYVNAFQTQPDDDGSRRDERSRWPAELVLELEDPDWPGEAPIDLSTPDKRAAAVTHVAPMLRTCARKGFDAVDLDNLDAFTRYEGALPYGRWAALDYAARLTRVAHRHGLAVAQKNTAELTREQARTRVDFDFAIAEGCARYRECGRYRKSYGKRVLIVEYRWSDLRRACRWQRDVSVVLRDRDLRTPREPGYRYARCRTR